MVSCALFISGLWQLFHTFPGAGSRKTVSKCKIKVKKHEKSSPGSELEFQYAGPGLLLAAALPIYPLPWLTNLPCRLLPLIYPEGPIYHTGP